MTQPRKPPVTKKHPRTKGDSWQNQGDRKPVNQREGGRAQASPQAQAEAYSDHPKNGKGENICGATNKRGKVCKLNAGHMTDHPGWGKCSFHGGNTPTLRTSAARFMGGEVIDRMTVSYGYGGPIKLTPNEALLQEVARTGGHVAWLADRIDTFDLGDKKKFLTPVQQEWLDLYHKERAHLVKVAKTAIDAGVSERLVKLAEDQGSLIIKAFNTVFDALGLTLDQRRMIPQVLPPVLRSMTEPQTQFVFEQVQQGQLEGP